MTHRSTLRFTFLLLLGSMACGKGTAPRTAPSPDAVLEGARHDFRRGRFRQALVAFQKVAFEYPPGHPNLAEAKYFAAESQFQVGDLEEAATDFRRVADDHANTPYGPLALLRAGDARLRQWHNPEFDPTPGETALALYQELAGRYPGTGAAARAVLHVRRLREWFAEKTYKTGVFYQRRRAYDSAILYLKDVVATYPESRLTPLALLRLVDVYGVLQYKDEVQETCAHLYRYYPQAPGLAKTCPAGPAAAP
jgi:outer membrane protein assembly factor BamD